MQYHKEGILRKVYTLVFVRDLAKEKILLGYKKRGFGMNKWNGLGGKVEPNETILEGAKRYSFFNFVFKSFKFQLKLKKKQKQSEAREESGLEILSIKKVGYIEFQFESNLSEMLEVHMFSGDKFKGELRECDEIRPEWFDTNKIPFEKMWKDDSYWFPKMLSNQMFKAYFLFKEDLETIIHYSIEDTKEL